MNFNNGQRRDPELPGYQAFGGPSPASAAGRPADTSNEPKKGDPLDYLNPGPGPCKVPEGFVSLDFKDVFTEEEHTTTHKNIYALQQLFYTVSKLGLYNVLSFSVGIPLAILWGIVNAIMMFMLVWVGYPLIKMAYMTVWPMLSGLYMIGVSPWLIPLIDTHARIFRQLRVHVTMNNGERRSINPS